MVKVRCFGAGDPLYEAYHDEEWGRPVADSPDERELFERVCLEGFQAGLSWITVLRKRDAFRAARPHLKATLFGCRSGIELRERGYELDVEIAADLDVSQCAPVLRNGAYEDAAA